MDRFYTKFLLRFATPQEGDDLRWGGVQVYLVQGIIDPLDKVLPADQLPQMVEAVLLPFKGKIIYDGLLLGYSIAFGSGIRSRFTQIYLTAKHKQRIVTSLEPELTPPKLAVPKGTKDLLPKLQALAEKLSVLKGDSAVQNAALALARASLELTIVAKEGPENMEGIYPAERKVRRAATRLFNLLEIIAEE